MPEYDYADKNRIEYSEGAFNGNKCRCAKATMLSTGGGGQSPEVAPNEQQRYSTVARSPEFDYSPASYPSSSRSVPCPEGPENSRPSISVADNTDNRLSISPEDVPNETEYRDYPFLNADMSYQLQRFILDQEYDNGAYAAPSLPLGRTGYQFLLQDPYDQPQTSMMAVKSSKKSKQSKKSKTSSGDGDIGYVGYGADPTSMMGSWDAEGGDEYHDGEGYPLTMSGVLG